MTRILPLALFSAACGGGVVDTLIEETVSFDGYDSVSVMAETGRVVVSEGNGDSIEVTYVQNNANERWQDRDDAGVLIIEATCADDEVGCSAGFRLSVPPGTNVAVMTTEGEIDLSGSLAGDFDLQTISGNLLGTDLGQASVSALTNGPVDLRFTERPRGLDIDGGKESLYAEIPAGSYDLQLDAGGGTSVADGIIDDDNGTPIKMQSVSTITLSES
jgi:hypothetical protein